MPRRPLRFPTTTRCCRSNSPGGLSPRRRAPPAPIAPAIRPITASQPALALPAESGTVFLPGPAGRLELAVDLPPAHEARRGIAVICHPNPPDGGTMFNKVVTMSARALNELGLATVRFNFRGTGQSEGAFDNGRGEC